MKPEKLLGCLVFHWIALHLQPWGPGTVYFGSSTEQARMAAYLIPHVPGVAKWDWAGEFLGSLAALLVNE